MISFNVKLNGVIKTLFLYNDIASPMHPLHIKKIYHFENFR